MGFCDDYDIMLIFISDKLDQQSSLKDWHVLYNMTDYLLKLKKTKVFWDFDT